MQGCFNNIDLLYCCIMAEHNQRKYIILNLLTGFALGGLIVTAIIMTQLNNSLKSEIESIKRGNLYANSLSAEVLDSDVFTTIELELEDGTKLIGKVSEGIVDNGSLVGATKIITDSGEVLEANVTKIGIDSVLEDVNGQQIIARLGKQWLLPDHLSEEVVDYLAKELGTGEDNIQSVLSGEEILAQIGSQWVLLDDLHGEVIEYLDARIATKVDSISIPESSLADGSVLEVHLAEGSVSGSKIKNGTITANDLASGSITTAKILDGTITNVDISSSAGISWSKIDKSTALLSQIGGREAQYISLTDTGDNYAGTNIELALQEIAIGTTLDGRYLQSFTEVDPTLDSWSGSSNIITVGTITTGVWNGDPVTSEYIEDGTILFDDLGQNGCTDGQVISYNGSGTNWECADVSTGGISYQMVNGTTDISTSSSTFSDMDEMFISMETEGNPVEILFSLGLGNSTTNGVTVVQLLIDDTPVVKSKFRSPSATLGPGGSLIWMHTPAAGTHEYKIQWGSESGTSYNRVLGGIEHRTMIVKEYR